MAEPKAKNETLKKTEAKQESSDSLIATQSKTPKNPKTEVEAEISSEELKASVQVELTSTVDSTEALQAFNNWRANNSRADAAEIAEKIKEFGIS